MDESLERLREAAQAGNIDALYAVIQDDANVFQRIDQMEFIDSPLHIAAGAGHIDFAMEMMNLKPSFARKLNQRGLSPIHLALQNQQNEMVINLLSFDKDLVRVRGREGYTPLHVVAGAGNVPLLSQFLDHCPKCIVDLTIRKETALHIAAKNNRLEALKAMLHFIHLQEGILNWQDKDGNTVLHIAAANTQPQMIELLTKCKGIRLSPLSKYIRQLFLDISEMKPETTNALLVVFVLILTMTYQAVLSPPRGLLPGDGNSKNVGKSAMNFSDFRGFFITNGIAFLMAWTITISLLSAVARSIISLVYPLFFLMWVCYLFAVGAISPSDSFATYQGAVVLLFQALLGCLVFYCLKMQ